MRNQEYFIKIIKENEGIIYKITRVYTQNETDQKDLYQEIVYQLWKGFEKFRGDAKVSTWMYRIALNTALFFNKQAQRNGHNVGLEMLHLKQETTDVVMEERIQLLYTHIKELQAIDRGIILLYLEGKKHDEIAIITGLSTSNIGTRIGRIKKRLKKSIKK